MKQDSLAGIFYREVRKVFRKVHKGNIRSLRSLRLCVKHFCTP